MKLSESEMRFVKKWRKYQRWWPRMRWLCLFASVGFTITWALILHRLAFLGADSSQDAAAVAWLSPVCWLCLFMSSGWIGFTFAYWRGDMKTRLLLRLVEEREHEDA
jgi:Na+-driven multidrug efflux pump